MSLSKNWHPHGTPIAPQFLTWLKQKKLLTTITPPKKPFSMPTDFIFWDKPSSTITNFGIFFKGLCFNFNLSTELPFSCCTELRNEKNKNKNRSAMAVTHLVPGHLVPHNWSPIYWSLWTNGPQPILSPWTNGPQPIWSPWTNGP